MIRAVVACLVAALLFGASTPASKALVGSLGPLTLAGLLYLGAALGVAPWAVRGGSRAWRSPKSLRRLSIAVVLGGGVAPVLLLRGLAQAPSASVSLWLTLETVATAVIAWRAFHEHLHHQTWIAIALIVIAGVGLAAPASIGPPSSAALVAVACLCWGIDNNLTAVIDGLTPAQVTFAKGAVAGAVNLALGLAIEGAPSHVTDVPFALAVGAFGYGASIVLYVVGAQQLGATRSQMIFASAPFFGVALAWAVLGERVALAQIGAGALIALALVLLLREAHEHAHTHDAVTHTHSHRHDDDHHDHAHSGLPRSLRHTHEHSHEALSHSHSHAPDLHHRHGHERESSE